MQAQNFKLDEYLQRIGYTGPLAPDAATLAGLLRAQLRTVPFENLAVQAGHGVSLVPEDIVHKIVVQGRGGYCYEVNSLFAMAVQALGLSYRLLAARPMFYPARRPRTHMVLLVEAEGRSWLCDAGFGNYGMRAPLPLDSAGQTVAQDGDSFRLSQPEAGQYVLEAWVQGAWLAQFGFDLWPQELLDFAPANYLNSTHPDTIFVQKMLVVLHQAQGRQILLGDTLKTYHAGELTEEKIPAEQLAAVLKERFGLLWPLPARVA